MRGGLSIRMRSIANPLILNKLLFFVIKWAQGKPCASQSLNFANSTHQKLFYIKNGSF
jgi:hypothetical protein